jgi:hypothetical protein
MVIFALMPPLPFPPRLLFAGIGVFLSGWILIIVRMWRPEQMTVRLVWALGIAASFVTLLWAIESSIGPDHWQRDGSLSVLTGCLASIVASWAWVPKSNNSASMPPSLTSPATLPEVDKSLAENLDME